MPEFPSAADALVDNAGLGNVLGVTDGERAVWHLPAAVVHTPARGIARFVAPFDATTAGL
jgi:hypothetical protein